MNDLLIVIAIAVLLSLIVAGFVERRRQRSYEDFRQRHNAYKAEVERQARKQL